MFQHRVAGAAETMGAALVRAAYSPNIKERRDLSCAVFDADGRLLAQAAHIPVHLGALEATVAAARHTTKTWQPGDVVLLNDPYRGGSHLPDLSTVSPVFRRDGSEPMAYVATRAHHADVGGAEPGSMALSRDLLAEGLVIPPVRIRRGGSVDPDVMALICANSRSGAERRGDLEAQLGAHTVGETAVGRLAADPVSFEARAQALLNHGEAVCRAFLARLPHGTARFADTLDSDGLIEGPVEIQAAVSVNADGLTVDFAGSADQRASGVNAPLAVTRSAVYYVVACLLGTSAVNAGTFRPITVFAPKGSMVNPVWPAPVAGGNVETSQRVVDVVLGALSSLLPDEIPAASQGTMNNVMFGGWDPGLRRPFSYYETLPGGAGAGPQGSGASAIQVHMTNTRSTPVEALEAELPVRIDGMRMRRGSGGSGRHAGGDGVERRIRFLVPARVSLFTDRRTGRPYGLADGQPGAAGTNRIVRADGSEEDLPAKGTVQVAGDDVVVIATPGGGGWGGPPRADRNGGAHGSDSHGSEAPAPASPPDSGSNRRLAPRREDVDDDED